MHLSRLASFKVYYALVTEKIEETNPRAMAQSSPVPFCDFAHVLWRVSCIHHGCATRATAYSLRVVSSIFYILKIVVYDTSRLESIKYVSKNDSIKTEIVNFNKNNNSFFFNELVYSFHDLCNFYSKIIIDGKFLS